MALLPKRPTRNQPDWWHKGINFGVPVKRCEDKDVHEAHVWKGKTVRFDVDSHDLSGNRISLDMEETPRYRCTGIAPPLPLAWKVWDTVGPVLGFIGLLVAFFGTWAFIEQVVWPAVFDSP